MKDIFDEDFLTNESAKVNRKCESNVESSKFKRQNIFSLKKNFSQQKLNEILSKNENEESSQDNNKSNFIQENPVNYEEMSLFSEKNSTNNAIPNRDNRKLFRNNSFRAAIGEIQIQNTDNINCNSLPQKEIGTLPKKRCSLARSATNEFTRRHTNKNDFDFKIPESILPNQLLKSVSMNFSTLEPSTNEAKKRKISCSSTSSNSNSSSQLKLTSNREHKTRKTTDSSVLTPSLIALHRNGNSLNENFDFTQEYSVNLPCKSLNNYSSLCNLNSLNFNNMTRSNLSLNELSSFIKYNLPKSGHKDPIGAINSNNEDLFSNALSLEIDSEVFHFVLNAFRLCSLMLPPNDKRKLHLLLRFLNKLKHNKFTAKYLLPSKFDANYDDLRFIDSSLNEPMKRSQLNSDLEFKSTAIESMIVKSFLKTIVCSENGEQQKKDIIRDKLSIKLVQILIDNYTEIMRIPEDLKSNVIQKLNAEKKSLENQQRLSHEPRKEFSHKSKITLQQYDHLTKQELTNMLNSILTDITMSENERLNSIKKFKDAYPLIYEEKYSTIKKALNILGISETGRENLNEMSSENSKKERDFSTDSTFKKSCTIANNNSIKRMITSSTSSSSRSNVFATAKNITLNLNRTTALSTNQSTSSKSSMTSMLQATSSSINFSKLFMNKKKKDTQ